MLMSVKCSAVTSIAVALTYDDNYTKNETISLGDIISVEFNKNGCRRKMEGKVIFISTNGNDPKNWYIIIDRSEDFEADKVRICPQNILDVKVIRAAATIKTVKTTNDRYSCPYIRIVNKKLQFSVDGIHWKSVLVDPSDIDIRDEGGTEEEEDEHVHRHHRHHRHSCSCCDVDDDDDVVTDPDDDDDSTTGSGSSSNSGSSSDGTLPDIIIDNSL